MIYAEAFQIKENLQKLKSLLVIKFAEIKVTFLIKVTSGNLQIQYQTLVFFASGYIFSLRNFGLMSEFGHKCLIISESTLVIFIIASMLYSS